MITDDLRPVFLDDIDGQPLAVKLLKTIAANPDPAPKCLLLYGPYGTGKTSAARAFAHAVNNVTQPDKYIRYISEFNCASFRERKILTTAGTDTSSLEESLMFGRKDWEIVIFDEIQGASTRTQTELLTLMERVLEKTFFMLCTTELDKLLPTLRSRCMLVEFQSISYNDVYKNLETYEHNAKQNIPYEIKSLIARKCNGHMRDAHIELSKYLMVGEKEYINGATSYYGLIADMFIAAHKGDKDSTVKALNQLSANPLFNVKHEFENFIVDCGNMRYTGEESPLEDVKRLLVEYGDDFTDIVDFYTSIWDNSLFSSERHFYMYMLSFYRDLEKKRLAA